MPTSWHDRNQYGNIVKNLIKTQYKTFQKTKDQKQKLKLSQNVAYLIQIQNSLINDFEKKQESQFDPKVIEELIIRNQKLEMELSNAENRAEYYPTDPKRDAEIRAFQKLTTKQQIKYHEDLQKEHEALTL